MAPASTANDPTLERERERIAASARLLASEGLVLGTSGNVSERSGELVAITPTGAVLAELEPGQIAVVDMEGTQVHGELAPTSELDLHLGIYSRHGAGGVVHTLADGDRALVRPRRGAVRPLLDAVAWRGGARLSP